MVEYLQAVKKAKEALAEIKGANIPVCGRALIDWLDFTTLKKELVNGRYTITCELKENIFSDKRVKYEVIVRKEDAVVEDVRKIPSG